MTKTLYGPHFMSSAYNHRDLLSAWQPAVALLLHPKPEDVALLREESPETIIVGRMYRDDHWYSEGIKNDPKVFAAEVHSAVMSTDWWQMVDYVQTNNEVMQSYHWIDGDAPGEIERLATYSLEWMQYAQGNYSCAIGAFSVGNPDIEEGWPLFYGAMRHALKWGHILLIHEYGWPDFWQPHGEWHLGRYAQRVWPVLPGDLHSLPVVMGEFGYDRLIEHVKGGWRSTGLDAGQVAEQLMLYHNNFNEWRARGVNLLGVCLYCIDPGGGWDDYDFKDGGDSSPISLYMDYLPEDIAAVGSEPPPVVPPEPEPEPEPPEPEIPPPGVDEMIEVYDAQGNRQDWAWLEDTYGTIQIDKAPATGKAFRVVRVQAKENGESDVKVTLLGSSGNNICFYWPDAPRKEEGCTTQPKNNFIVQHTSNQTSFALGPGAYYWPPQRAVHKIWVCSSLPSDVINDVGMLSGSNHHHLDWWIELSDGGDDGGGEVPPVLPPAGGDVEELLHALLTEVNLLRVHLGA